MSSRNPAFLSVCWVAASLQAVNHIEGSKAVWTTALVSLQGMAPATGLHSAGQLECTWHCAMGDSKAGFKPLLFLSSEAGKWSAAQQLPDLFIFCVLHVIPSEQQDPVISHRSLTAVGIIC